MGADLLFPAPPAFGFTIWDEGAFRGRDCLLVFPLAAVRAIIAFQPCPITQVANQVQILRVGGTPTFAHFNGSIHPALKMQSGCTMGAYAVRSGTQYVFGALS